MQWVPWASPELDEPEHLEPLCVELQRIMRGELVEVCVSVPPRHGKSTTIHHAVAMLLSRNPRARILYASYDAEFASKNLKAIRRICLAVGLAIGDKDNKFEFTLAEGGGVMACGIQAPPTGEGFDLVVIDDPIRKLADALSKAVRDRIGTGFGPDLYSRQSPGRPTSFVIVATRWHQDDLTGRQAELGWKVINLPALIEQNGVVRALAPKMWPIEKLEKFRTQNRDGYTWDALYMGNPNPRTGRMFGDVHLVNEVPADGVVIFGVDLAHTAKQRSDRSGIVETIRDEGVVYVSDFFADRQPLTDHIAPSGRVTSTGFVTQIEHRMARHPGARAGMYTGRDEDLVLELISKVSDRVYIEAMRAVTDKRHRAQPAAAAWNRGDIRVPREGTWVDDFLAHVISFTGADGGEDEEVDCLSVAWDMHEASGGTGVAVELPTSSDTRLRHGMSRGRKLYT